ncbi:hypothetical protein GCM10007170_13640 [Arthrobacter liuii]|uniref:Uncharacterized protein n=1 Tax=Arthrobacter liuii TaxID=1476996 RepID=A0ABQ2AKX7_9MICC|nr:hypothetical protein GCM10007170_13640 [Arthrobacter liuii]
MTHWLVGSSSENCRASVAEGDGDGASGDEPTVATSGVAPGESVTAAGEEEAADDDGTTLGASGVQADRTVSPAPAARKRVKLRRVEDPHW